MKEFPFKLIGERFEVQDQVLFFPFFLGTDISNKKETTNVSVNYKFTSSM